MVTWLNMEGLAEYLKTSKSTLYKLVSKKRLIGHKVGRGYLFDQDEVDQMVKQGKLWRRGRKS